MGRLHITSMLAFGVLFACTTHAFAQSGVCADVTVERSDEVSRQDVTVERERAVDDVIDAIVGVELSPLELAPPLAPASDEDLPWCTSDDDPRCSKRPAGSQPSRFEASSTSLPALPDAARAIAPPSAPSRRTPHSGAGPRTGVQLRVERPPR